MPLYIDLANEFLAANPMNRPTVNQKAAKALNATQLKLYEEEKKRDGLEINDYDVQGFAMASKETGADLMALLGVPITENDIEKFTYRYWFNYFWSEGQGEFLKSPNAVKSAAMLKLVVKRLRAPIPSKAEFREGGTQAIVNRITTHYELKSGASDLEKREFLTHLLKLGFRTGPMLSVSTGSDESIKGLASTFYQYSRHGSDHADKQKIFWRGESRSPEQVMIQATTRLSDIPSLADSMNMSREWNPFSDHQTNSYMWYRNGTNSDNDYYTAVSVALNFATACCFPKINEKRVYDFPNATPLSWTPEQLEKFRNSLGQVSINANPTTMVVTKTTLYLSAPSGPTVFTQSVQGKNSFPEFAVSGITHEEIFGYLTVYRAFQGVDEKSKFIVFIDKVNSSRVRFNKKTKKVEKVASELQNKTQFKPETWKALCEEYDHILQLQPFETNWDGNGATSPVPKPGVHLASPPPLSSASFLALTRRVAPVFGPKNK